MLFDPKPKTEKKDLFGMDFTLKNLVKAIKDDSVRMVVIKGLRRTGKTSLLNVALKEAGVDYVKIDVRESPYYDRNEFLNFILEKINEKLSKIRGLLKDLEIKILYKDIGIGFKIGNKISMLEKVNKKLKVKKKKLILAFDEAQFLQEIGFNSILASIYDNYEQFKIILTGSEIGLLDEFIGRKDARSPLFGRGYIEINTKRFDVEKSAEFLARGFQEIKKKITAEEIRDVINEFDGIVGWLTLYGWLRKQGLKHDEALRHVVEEGKRLAREEFRKFLEKRKAKSNYMLIMKLIAKTRHSWTLLKKSFIEKGKRITDRQLALYLKELVDYGFIEKENGNYFFTDPIYSNL